MNKQTLVVAIALANLSSFSVYAGEAAGAGDFISGSKASISSRTMYFNNDNRAGGADQKEAAQGLLFNYASGYTQGTIGLGVDAQVLTGIHLDGGRGHHPDKNTFSPSDSDGSAEQTWSRAGANVKVKLADTTLKVGNALSPELPILNASESRVLPQTFQGGMLTSKVFNDVTLNVGKITDAVGRASSNSSGLSVSGATKDSNSFQFAGADWKITRNLTAQAYHAQLKDFYNQTFLGLVYLVPIGNDQTLKTDLRYFDSNSDGKNGQAGYRFNNNGGYAKDAGEVSNRTWSAMFTYALGGHSLMVGHQRVSDDGGFVWVNNGSIADSRGRNEGQGGSDFYLFTNSMINQFARAGENTTFGQYSFNFASVGIAGLKMSAAYLHGDDIKDVKNGSDHSEWERDMRVAYTVQEGPLKNLSATLRHGVYRGDGSGGSNTDQTRLIFDYTYNFM